MPVQKTRSGGYRYGPRGAGGKTYYGRGAKAKAQRQGRAISISKARKAGHHIPVRRSRHGKK